MKAQMEEMLEALIEKEQIELATNRLDIRGTHSMGTSGKGGLGRFVKNSGMTKGVRGGVYRRFTFDVSKQSWNLFLNKEINFDELKTRQAKGL